MEISVTVQSEVQRPREEVAAFVMDPGNDLRWIGALSEARILDDGPVEKGTKVLRVAKFLGKRVEYVNEIDEIVPGSRLVMHSVKAPFAMRVAYHFEDGVAGGTRVRVEAGGDTGGYYHLAGPVLPFFVRAGIKRDLRKLKQVLEG